MYLYGQVMQIKIMVVGGGVGVKFAVVISLLETTSHPLLGGIQYPVGYFLIYAI